MLDALWLTIFQRLSAGVAHELRNSLNGVAVNLEVVRSRSGRDGVAASALGSFAASASEQLEQVIAMTEALVALGRPARSPAAIGRCADQVAILLRPPLVANGGRLDLVVEGEGTTRVPADAARTFVAAALCAAVESAGEAGEVRCLVRPANGVELQVEGGFAAPPRLAMEIERAAAELAVGVRSTASGITLTFPAQGG
ncbi:MAG TPA: hypothetical protein VF761_03505 [Gemmatimonadaceae bacterium]